MTTYQILDLDCRNEEDAKIVQEELKKIKPLSKCKDKEVPLSMIEKLIHIISKRYKVNIERIECDILSRKDSTIWRAKIILYTRLQEDIYAYGVTLYEVMAKTALYMYLVKDQVGRWGENK